MKYPNLNSNAPIKACLILYTVYTYDPHADLIKMFPTDFNRRKREAALKAGFLINAEGSFDKWVEDCILGENESYNAAIVSFVTKFNMADLSAFVMYREIFFSEFLATMSAKDSASKKAAMTNAETARQQVADLERKIFTGEETVNLRSALYAAAEKLKLNLRPEEKAHEIQSKKLKVSDPYYKFSQK